LDLLTFPPSGCLPTVEEMAPSFLLSEEQRPAQKPKGLFQEMLQGNPSHLLQLLSGVGEADTTTHAVLLRELQAGARSYDALSPEERALLDEATFMVLTAPVAKRKVTQPFQHVKEKEDEQEWKDSSSGPAPSDLQGLPAFWWV